MAAARALSQHAVHARAPTGHAQVWKARSSPLPPAQGRGLSAGLRSAPAQWHRPTPRLAEPEAKQRTNSAHLSEALHDLFPQEKWEARSWSFGTAPKWRKEWCIIPLSHAAHFVPSSSRRNSFHVQSPFLKN